MAQSCSPCHASGTNGAGGARSRISHTASSRGASAVSVAVRPQDLVRALERPGDQAAVDGRADLVQAEGEAT